jgi:HK97 family phage major capsid protein
MRTITDIQADVRARLDKVNAMDASNVEEINALNAEIKGLMQELDAAKTAEAAEQALVDRDIQKEARKGNTFSFLRFIQGAISGKMEGLEADMAAAGQEEYNRAGLRAYGYVIPSAVLRAATGQGAGESNYGQKITVTGQRYVEDVKERLTVARMGATVLNGLVGNVDLPYAGAVTASFLNESVSTSVVKSTIAKQTLTPRGCRATMVTTRDLMKQSSVDVERVFMDRLADAAAACLDKEALTQIISNATDATGADLWHKMVAMETNANSKNANRGSMGYILSSKLWGEAKTTLKSSGVSGYILENGMINGYKADFTNQFAANSAVFGNFADVYLGNWGGIDILVDPFSLGDKGEIKLQLFYYCDAKVTLGAKSFAKLTIASGSGI